MAEVQEALKDIKGVRGLRIATLIKDTKEAIEFDTPVRWAGASGIGNETEESSASKYYDNKAALATHAEGADTWNIASSVPHDRVKAKIEGRYYVEETGEFLATPMNKKYNAFGFIGKDTNNVEYAFWVYKNMVSGGNEQYDTEDDGTDSNGVEYECTSIYTEHVFTKGGQPLKYYKIPLAKVEEDEFFSQVTTPDNVKLKEVLP